MMTEQFQCGNGQPQLGTGRQPTSISPDWRPSPPDAELRSATAYLLRCRELWPRLLCESSPSPVDLTTHPATLAVIETATALYTRHRQLPQDQAVLAVEVNRRMREADDWTPQAAADVDALLNWCFGPETGVIQADRGREIWSQLVTTRLLSPLLSATGTNARSAPLAIVHPMDQIKRLWGWLEDLHRNAAHEALRFISSQEFAATDHTLEWHIPQVLAIGQPCVVGGPSKSLKTSIVMDLAVSLAAPIGNQFLGQFEAEPARRVLFVSAESGEATIKETAQRIGRTKAMGVRLSDLNITWCFQAPRLSQDSDVEAIRRELEERPVDVAIFDPLYLCLLADNANVSASDLYQMGPLLRKISKLCLDAGATPILVHHFNRPGAMSHEAPTLENLAFAGIGEFARQWLLINRRQKYASGTGHHELWLAAGGSVGHSRLWAVDIDEGQLRDDFQGRRWCVTIRTPDDMREVQRDERRMRAAENRSREDDQTADRIVEHLRANPAGDTENRIRSIVGSGQDRCRRALDRLQQNGRIESAQVTRQRQTYDGYRLIQDAPDTQTETSLD